jgi:phosphate transport system permease protein
LFRSQGEWLFVWFLRFLAGLTSLIVLLIVFFVFYESLPALKQIRLTRFFTDSTWHPAAGVDSSSFSLTPMAVGTVLTVMGAILLSAPLGVATAILVRFYSHPVTGKIFKRMIELLGGIPSVVYGFWGMAALAPLIRQWQPPGQSLLTGILVLSVMILPTVALLSESALAAIPREYLLAAEASGLPKRAIIGGVALSAARAGILTAILLATGRAIGETMAVMMVSGNVVQVPSSLFDPVRTLTVNIALELGYALDLHRSALFVSGLILVFMIILLALFTEISKKKTN